VIANFPCVASQQALADRTHRPLLASPPAGASLSGWGLAAARADPTWRTFQGHSSWIELQRGLAKWCRDVGFDPSPCGQPVE
jgi:hypothetical protein